MRSSGRYNHIAEAQLMKDQKNAGYPTENTFLTPIKPEKPVEESKLRHLTDEEIIWGFRYLMSKDKKDK